MKHLKVIVIQSALVLAGLPVLQADDLKQPLVEICRRRIAWAGFSYQHRKALRRFDLSPVSADGNSRLQSMMMNGTSRLEVQGSRGGYFPIQDARLRFEEAVHLVDAVIFTHPGPLDLESYQHLSNELVERGSRYLSAAGYPHIVQRFGVDMNLWIPYAPEDSHLGPIVHELNRRREMIVYSPSSGAQLNGPNYAPPRKFSPLNFAFGSEDAGYLMLSGTALLALDPQHPDFVHELKHSDTTDQLRNRREFPFYGRVLSSGDSRLPDEEPSLLKLSKSYAFGFSLDEAVAFGAAFVRSAEDFAAKVSAGEDAFGASLNFLTNLKHARFFAERSKAYGEMVLERLDRGELRISLFEKAGIVWASTSVLVGVGRGFDFYIPLVKSASLVDPMNSTYFRSQIELMVETSQKFRDRWIGIQNELEAIHRQWGHSRTAYVQAVAKLAREIR